MWVCLVERKVHIGGYTEGREEISGEFLEKLPFKCTIVSCKYAPPFCNLTLSTKRRGGSYTGCDIFSHHYAPPPRLSGSVDADFILVLPFHHNDLEPDCVGVSTREGNGGQASS